MNDHDLDLPEITEEHIAEFKRPVIAEDLHLGPAEVKPFNSTWYKQYSPQPPGWGIRSLDAVIVIMGLASLWLLVISWSYALS